MRLENFYRVGDCSLREVMGQIDKGGKGLLCILDENYKMVGLITDGDIRRHLLRGAELGTKVHLLMNRDFTFWPKEKSRQEGYLFLKKANRRHLPVLDGNGCLVDMLLLDDHQRVQYRQPVVIMVGGLGTRLRPHTANCPKPLLKVGNKPLLERTIQHFIQQGFSNFYLSVNYLAEMIEGYFGNGHQLDVSIRYLREPEPLGTAGSLSLLSEEEEGPVLVINGDIVTDLDLRKVLSFHEENGYHATMCVREMEFNLPYGVVETTGNTVVNLREKPSHSYLINAGIYSLSMDAIRQIPKLTRFDMTQLVDKLMIGGHAVGAFPVRDYWLDIGRQEDYLKAILDSGELAGF